MTKTYKFNDPESMISLAKEIQSCVYWNMTFTLTDGDEDEHIPYSDFWDECEVRNYQGYNVVTINFVQNTVEFNR